MQVGNVNEHINALRQRVRQLYRSAGPPTEQPSILQQAFEELATAEEVILLLQQELTCAKEALPNAICELEGERQRYQALFDGAPDGYLVTSLDGTIRTANESAARLLGISPKELVGRSLMLLLPPGERRSFRNQLRALHTPDQQQRWDVLIASRSGAAFPCEFVVRVVGDSMGKPTSLRWRMTPTENRKEGAALPDGFITRTQQAFTVLAEASALLASTSDDSVFPHIAHLVVPHLADICTIDIAEQGGAVRQLVVLRDVRTTETGAQEFHCRYWPDIEADKRWLTQHASSPDSHNTLATFGSAVRAHDPTLLPLLRLLRPQVALLVPLQATNQLLGALMIGVADTRDWFGPIENILFQELARRMVTILQSTRTVGI